MITFGDVYDVQRALIWLTITGMTGLAQRPADALSGGSGSAPGLP